MLNIVQLINDVFMIQQSLFTFHVTTYLIFDEARQAIVVP